MRFLLFVSVVIAVYAAMNAVVLWGVHPLLVGRPRMAALLTVWMGLMILGPLAVVLLERSGHESTARGLAMIAYTWLGLLFLAFSLFAVLGVWELAAWFAGEGLPRLSGLSVHGTATAILGIFIAAGCGVYGFFEAGRLRVETVKIVTSKLGPGRDRVRLVQVSDLHLGLLNRERALAAVVARLGELQPDLLLATGDVVDAQLDHLDGLSDLWRRIDPPLGKFAVTGNHEAYAGLDQSLDFLRRSGFTVLRGEGMTLAGSLNLVGVDDDHVHGPRREAGTLLRAQPRALFTVLLKHRPSVSPDAAGCFDLQLSGHTHLGQIFHFRYVTALQYPLQNGLYELPGGGRLYTSRGTGTWGPPMRVLAPPEITVFDLIREGLPPHRPEI